MASSDESRSSTPSDEETVDTDYESEYCYRCIPLLRVDRENEKAIYGLCPKSRLTAVHRLLSSGQNPLELKERFQRALLCTKCPPVDKLSETEKLQAEITVMVRDQGREEVFEELNKAKKNIELLQKRNEEINEVIGKQKDQKPDEVQSSSVSWITKRTDKSKFCYRCIPLCLDDQKKENDVKEAMVLDLDRYLNSFLYLKFDSSEGFDAQKMFDSAFKCENCPNIKTANPYVQKCAKLVVLIRHIGRVAALRIVNNDVKDLAKGQRRTAAACSGSPNKHRRHWKTYSNLFKRQKATEGRSLRFAGSTNHAMVPAVDVGDQSTSSDQNRLQLKTTIPTTSKFDWRSMSSLVLEETEQSGSEASAAIPKNAPAPFYPERGFILYPAGFNNTSLLSSGDNIIDGERDRVGTSSTADENNKKMTGVQEITDRNITKTNEQSLQNAQVPVNPALTQAIPEDLRNNIEQNPMDDGEPSNVVQPQANRQKSQRSEVTTIHEGVDGEELLPLQGPMEIQPSQPPLTAPITGTDLGKVGRDKLSAEGKAASTSQESSTDRDNIIGEKPIPVGTSSTANTNGKEMAASVENPVNDGNGKEAGEESAPVPVHPAPQKVQEDVTEKTPESAGKTDDRFPPTQATPVDLRNDDEEIPMDEGEPSNTPQPYSNKQEPQCSEGSPNHAMNLAVGEEVHLPLQEQMKLQSSLPPLTMPIVEPESGEVGQLEGSELVAQEETTLTSQEYSTDGDNIIDEDPIPVTTSSTADTNGKEMTGSVENPVDDGNGKEADEDSSQNALVPVNPALEKIQQVVTEETPESAGKTDVRPSPNSLSQATSDDLRNDYEEIPMDEGEQSNTPEPHTSKQDQQRSEARSQKMNLAVDEEEHLPMQEQMEIQSSPSLPTVPTTEIQHAQDQFERNELVAEEGSPSMSQESSTEGDNITHEELIPAVTSSTADTNGKKMVASVTNPVEDRNGREANEDSSQNAHVPVNPALEKIQQVVTEETPESAGKTDVRTFPTSLSQATSDDLSNDNEEIPMDEEEPSNTLQPYSNKREPQRSETSSIPKVDLVVYEEEHLPSQEQMEIQSSPSLSTVPTTEIEQAQDQLEGNELVAEEGSPSTNQETTSASKKRRRRNRGGARTQKRRKIAASKTKITKTSSVQEVNFPIGVGIDAQNSASSSVPAMPRSSTPRRYTRLPVGTPLGKTYQLRGGTRLVAQFPEVSRIDSEEDRSTSSAPMIPNSDFPSTSSPVVSEEITQNGCEASATSSEKSAAPAPVYPKTLPAGSNVTVPYSSSTNGDNNIHEETGGQEEDDGNQTKADEQSSQNALVPVNPDIDDQETEVDDEILMDYGEPSTSHQLPITSYQEIEQEEQAHNGNSVDESNVEDMEQDNGTYAPSNDEEEIEKERKKRELREHSINWLITQKLISIHADEIEEDKKRKVEDRVPQWKRDMVASVIKKRMEGINSHCKRRDIDLETQFPDQDDYRRCREYLKKLCTETVQFEEEEHHEEHEEPLPQPPRISLTGPMYIPHHLSSRGVLKYAAEWAQKRTNTVFKKLEKLERPTPDKTLFEEETDFYSDGSEEKDKCRRACPVIEIKNKEQLMSPELEKTVTKAPITVLSRAFEHSDIDRNLYSLEEIAKLKPREKIRILHQVPQAADQNKAYSGEDTWTVPIIEDKDVTMRTFQRQMKRDYSHAKKLYEAVLKSRNQKEAERKLEKLAAKMPDIHLPPKGGFYGENYEELDQSLPWIRFGTNIDLHQEHYAAQFKALEKLPEFLRPTGSNNMLKQLTVKVLGVNTVQLYAKSCGCRTPAHMENSLMASINWNRGPGICVWYAIPYEYWPQIEQLAKENGAIYTNQDYWPGEDKLVENNIPFYKFEQKADELVYVNTGCFHFVQSNGYCENVSWNVGQPTFTQLATAMVAFDHNIESKAYNQLPLIQMVWAAAKNKKFVDDPEMFELMRKIMTRSLAHTRWYLDYLESIGYKIEDHPCSKYNARCKRCGTEVFNIVRFWVTKVKKEDVDHEYCSECPTPTEFEHLKPTFVFMFSEQELRDIFDAFVPSGGAPEGPSENGPTPGPSSSLPSQPPTPGPSTVTNVEDKDATPSSPSSSQSQQIPGPSSM